MISKNDLKYYSALLIKKYRQQENKFIVEGIKIVEEGLNSNFNCEAVFVTPAFIESSTDILNAIRKKTNNILEVKSADFQRISDTKSPQGIAAVFEKHSPKRKVTETKDKYLILIDNVSDPGNLGTIIRTCDWFGFYNILLTNNSVEYLNPKVVRASMGSIFHINIYDGISETDLLNLKKLGYFVVCSDVKGKNINSFSSEKKLIVSFSNEASGPSDLIKNLTDEKITIPGKGRAESLNVSSAAAIILSKFANE